MIDSRPAKLAQTIFRRIALRWRSDAGAGPGIVPVRPRPDLQKQSVRCGGAGLQSVRHGVPDLHVVRRACGLIALGLLLVFNATRAAGVEHVTFRRGDEQQQVAGEVVVTAADGGILLRGPDGRLWAITPEQLVARTSDDQPFAPLAREALAQQLLAELPPGFAAHETAHYLVLYNTSRAYAGWCGGLFERLYMAFNNFWMQRGFAMAEPDGPLVAIVFADRAGYEQHARGELGAAVQSVIGYYSLETNRMTMYDLTGLEALRGAEDRRGSAAQINRMLQRPEAERAVATIVHEATHQIAFNSGLHTRYADIPLWVSEGLAVYFEAPDLKSQRGWRTIGRLNGPRLARFLEYLPVRPADSLESLVRGDARFRDPQQAEAAYAEAWALNYFLLKQAPQAYLDYLAGLARKKPLLYDLPEQRLAEFRAAFGEDLTRLDADFLRFMSKLR